MHGDRRIGRTWPATDQRHAGASGQAAIGHSHVARPTFVPAGHHINPGEVDQSVEQAKITFARDKENAIHAVVGKNLEEGMTGGEGCHRGFESDAGTQTHAIGG